MNTSRNVALRASLLFAVIGFAWIFLSDRILNWMAVKEGFSLHTVTVIQDTKGIFFVTVCAVMLYLVVYRSTRLLRRSQQEYRNLFRHNPAPMFIYNPKTGAMIAMNERCCEMYGYAREEVKKIHIRDIIVSHFSDDPHFHQVDLPQGMKDVGLYRHRKKNGTEIWVHKYARKIEFENHIARLVLAFDVTEQVLAEEKLLKQNRRLADLAWFESHKLRAPIARLLGLLNVMRINSAEKSPSQEVLQHIYDTGAELDVAVRQLSFKTTSHGEENA